MESSGITEISEAKERLKSFPLQLRNESAILDRLVYKNKNQHRHCPHYQTLPKIQRDLRLLHSAELEEILTVLFLIVDGKQPAQKAYLPRREKKNKHSGKYNYQERLLGVARLLSQMTEPILKAAIQISFLLAKSFFTGFSLTVMALLARLRVLVQQMLLDVVSVFNKVSTLSQKKHAVKLTQDGIEAFREYYPSTGDVLTLECVWKEDKFVLLEKMHDRNVQNHSEDQEALPRETSIQYETVQPLSAVQETEHEGIQDNPEYPQTGEHCSIDIQPAVTLSADESATAIIDGMDDMVCQESLIEDPRFEENLLKTGGSFSVPESLGPQSESSNKVAFVPVRCLELEMNRSSKKIKLHRL